MAVGVLRARTPRRGPKNQMLNATRYQVPHQTVQSLPRAPLCSNGNVSNAIDVGFKT